MRKKSRMVGEARRAEDRLRSVFELDDESGCISLLVGTQLARVVRAWGAPASEPLPRRQSASRLDPDVQIFAATEALIVVELNSHQGIRPSVLRIGSSGGRCGSIGWTIDREISLVLAADSQIEFDEEVNGFRESAAPRSVSRYFSGLQFGSHRIGSAAIAIQRFTGTEFPSDRSSLRIVRAFASAPIPDDPRPSDHGQDLTQYCDEWQPVVTCVGARRVHEFVTAALANPDSCRSVAVWAARAALIDVGLINQPSIAATLNSLERGVLVSLPGDLARLADGHRRVERGLPFFKEQWAIRSLQAACDADPIRAGLDATFLAVIQKVSWPTDDWDVFFDRATRMMKAK